MQNVHPSKWGADAWRFLHTLGDAYPAEPDTATRRAMYELLASLRVLLPCAQCRQHLAAFMADSGMRSSESPALLDNKALRAWLGRAHTNANQHRDAAVGSHAATTAASPERSARTPRRIAAGASVVQPPAPRVLDARFATESAPQDDRDRGLIISFYIIAPVLLGVFLAFVCTWGAR